MRLPYPRTVITEQPALTSAEAAAVTELAARAALSDGTRPLNEAAELALAGAGSAQVRHFLARSGASVSGYAQLDLRDGSVQLVVDPPARRQGLGRELAQRVAATGLVQSWWAFGDLPAARALAGSLGLRVIRGLHQMTLDLAAQPPTQAAELIAGITFDHFRADDLDRLVAVNAAAFATHPEQGALTAADFTARMGADWYRDTDLLVARDASGELVGYHWTKLTETPERTTGEVYVLGVDPGQAGRGIGRALLRAGIIHMRTRGAQLIDLYVEAANQPVVQMYRSAGFEVSHTDVAYGRAEEE